MPFLKHFTFLCHQQWPSEKSIRHIVNIPILFLAGAKDELVPPSHMVALNELSETRGDKTWIAFPNGMHNDTCMQPGYFTAIRDYLELQVLKKEKAKTSVDKTLVDGKLVSENDKSNQLVSGNTDETGLSHSFEVVELEEE
jgi:fermentation-respiration switch protein FrsA (DUF1100 family)